MGLTSFTNVPQVISMNAHLVWYSVASAVVVVGGCSSLQASASMFFCEEPGGDAVTHHCVAGY